MRKCIAQKSRGDENDFMLALERGNGAEILGGRSAFVFRPGGTANPSKGVYTTWASLSAAVAQLDTASDKVVSIDTALGAAHVTIGTWPGFENTTFVSGGTDASSGATATLIFDQGAHLTGIEHITFDQVNLTFNSTAPVIPTTTANLVVTLNSLLTTNGAGGVGLADIGAGFSVLLRARIATVGGQLFTGSATSGYAVFLLDGSNLVANAINGTAGGVVDIVADGASQLAITTQTPAASVQILDPQPTFVFKPGATGTLDGNVFTTWAALMAAVALTAGPRTIVIDNSLAAAHMTAGAWDLDQVVLVGHGTLTFGNFHLIIDVGATFTSTSLSLINCKIQCNATATVWTGAAPPNSLDVALIIKDFSQLTCTAAGVFFASTGNFNVLAQAESTVGDGTHNVFSVANTKTARFYFFTGSQLAAHAVGGLGAFVGNEDASASVASQADAGSTAVNLLDAAALVAFTPTTAGNWNPQPSNVQGALDQLAAPNFTQASGNTGTGTGAASVVTGNITKARSGKVLVTANIAGTTSAGTTVTLQLVRDAATNIGNVIVETTLSAGDGFHGSITFVDTLPDTAAHTYKLTATAGAGNITVGGANSAQITAVEL